jgi:hypothetical protein
LGRRGLECSDDGQITQKLSSPLRKNISLNLSGKSLLQARPSHPMRGAGRDRHERAVGCGGRDSCERRTQLVADGEVVWFWRPDAGAKFCEDESRKATVAKKPVTGKSTKETVKTIRAGKAGVFPLNLYARVRFLMCTFAHETAGAARTRFSLRPLLFRRAKAFANLGYHMPRISFSLFEI